MEKLPILLVLGWKKYIVCRYCKYTELEEVLQACCSLFMAKGKWVKKTVVWLSCVAGIVSSLDIGLSNWSFDFISVSLWVLACNKLVHE